jgi:signal transduction histidine kinase
MIAEKVETSLELFDGLSEFVGSRDARPDEAFCRRLLDAYQAHGAGLAYPLDASVTLGPHAWAGEPAAGLPWQPWDEIAGRFENERRTAAVENEAGSWLLALVGDAADANPMAVWLYERGGRAWSESDHAGLRLTARLLGRLGGGMASPAERAARERAWLDQAAHITSRLSHDFGNVLTSVLGFTELARMQVGGGVARQYLDEVWDAARGGADWLKKLHFFCRRTTPDYTPASPAEAVATEAARARTDWPGGVTLETRVPAELPAVACEAGSLREALGQLLNNAREARPAGGTVTLTAGVVELDDKTCESLLGRPAPGAFVEFAIRDTGPGLPDDVRGRVFADLFFSTKPRHRGLGVLIVCGIARRFGGGLALDPAPDAGTVARLYFPVARPAATNGS